MPIVVNNNVASLIAQRNLNYSTINLTNSIERLSSGSRINRASDDAAGLSISENLRSQIRGNAKAMNNIQDGINMLSIAESGLGVIGENIQRIRELCIQAANDTNGANEKDAILSEIDARLKDISRISKASEFNGLSLLDGSLTTANLQVGAGNGTTTNVINIAQVFTDSDATALGIIVPAQDGTGSDTTSGAIERGETWDGDDIRSYIGLIDTALANITTKRSNLGAFQNRLESALENLTVMNENLQSSESRIRDVDVASESANMTKYQILQQASASVLSQANGIPQIALALMSR